MTRRLNESSFTLNVRANASPTIGYGHLTRTLAVVEALRDAHPIEVRYLMSADSDPTRVRQIGGQVTHLTSNDISEVIDHVTESGGPLLLDTYTTTGAWLQQTTTAGLCTMLFDDGCRLPHYAADLVIDYAPGADRLPYTGLDHTRWCLGPQYFPLGMPFRELSPSLRRHARKGTDPLRLLVTFGGSDPDDQTARVLGCLAKGRPPGDITVLLGPGYRGRAEVVARQLPGVTVLRNITQVAELFAQNDLAICGGGVTALELAFLGVPAICIVLCPDQCLSARELARAAAAIDLGPFDRLDDNTIASTIDATARDPALLRSMRQAGPALIDGLGAQRLATGVMDVWKEHCRRTQTPVSES